MDAGHRARLRTRGAPRHQPVHAAGLSPLIAAAGLVARGAIVATAMVFGLTYSLCATLIALDLAERGLDETVIGVNAAMHAVGVLAMAFLLPHLTACLGIRRAVVGSLLSAALLMLAFPTLRYLWLWFVLRLLLGQLPKPCSSCRRPG